MRFPLVEPPYQESVQRTFDKVNLGAWVPRKFLSVLAHSPSVMGNVVALGGSLMYKADIEERLREVAIFRVAARTRSNYEWTMHRALFEDKCGITPEQLAALKEGPSDSACFDEREQLIIRVVDELHDTSTVGDATWAAMGRHWSHQQILEILVLVGHYHLVAFFMNATGAEPEEGTGHLAADWPELPARP